jgi:hypothetical protein
MCTSDTRFGWAEFALGSLRKFLNQTSNGHGDALNRTSFTSFTFAQGRKTSLIFPLTLWRRNEIPPRNAAWWDYFTWDFASWAVHFLNVCVKNQQIHQLFFQFINYVWYLIHVLALHCHPQGTFLVPSERCSVEEQSIEYFGWACYV